MNITLQGKQAEVMALPVTGHTVVLGTAGSGKTTIALQRAIFLSNLPSKPLVLLVTFNNALVEYMKSINNRVCPGLVVESYHKFARGYLNSRGKMPSYNGVLSTNKKREYIEKAIFQCRNEYPYESTFERSKEFFYDEIVFIQQFGFKNFSEYQQAERIGRASAYITRENRKWIAKVYERYLELRAADGLKYDWDDLAFYANCELEIDNTERRYTHIIVDEGQDFSPMMIKSLVNATHDRGSFTFFGDVAQQIYGNRLSWRDSGIETSKIWKFEINYRNPESIIKFSQDIIKSKYWKQKMDMISATPFIAEGPKPILVRFSNVTNEIAWVTDRAISMSRTSSVVVVCRSYEGQSILESAFKNKGQYIHLISKDTPGVRNSKDIYISTYHSVKGLEFDYVFVPLLDSNHFPNQKAIEAAVSQEIAYSDELKLLYVAATRSKYGLYMTYSGELSFLFPESSMNYDYYQENDGI